MHTNSIAPRGRRIGFIPEDFEGVDGYHYHYVNPNHLTEQEREALDPDVVAEYKLTVTTDDADEELFLDRFIMAQHDASSQVDYELMLVARDWTPLEKLTDYDIYRRKIAAAISNRRNGTVVTDAFAQRLAQSTRDQMWPCELTNLYFPDIVDFDPRVGMKEDHPRPTLHHPFVHDMFGGQRENDGGITPTEPLTRKAAYNKIRQCVLETRWRNARKAEERLANPPGVELGLAKFEPDHTLFYPVVNSNHQFMIKLKQVELRSQTAEIVSNRLEEQRQLQNLSSDDG